MCTGKEYINKMSVKFYYLKKKIGNENKKINTKLNILLCKFSSTVKIKMNKEVRSYRYLLLSVSLLDIFTPSLVLVTIVTRTEKEGKIQNSEMSPE